MERFWPITLVLLIILFGAYKSYGAIEGMIVSTLEAEIEYFESRTYLIDSNVEILSKTGEESSERAKYLRDNKEKIVKMLMGHALLFQQKKIINFFSSTNCLDKEYRKYL